jgi:preprotein translocase subunit SecB
MSNAVDFPFELLNIFLINLNFKRGNAVPTSIELPVSTEIKMVESEFPRLQVNVKIHTPEDTPVSFNFEVVGVFNYIGENKACDQELNKRFVSQKALDLIYVHAIQMVRIITGQMGMNPVNLKTPVFTDIFKSPPSTK